MEWDDGTRGRHDGSVEAAPGGGARVSYFTCAPGRGSLMRPGLLTLDLLSAARARYEGEDDGACGGGAAPLVGAEKVFVRSFVFPC